MVDRHAFANYHKIATGVGPFEVRVGEDSVNRPHRAATRARARRGGGEGVEAGIW